MLSTLPQKKPTSNTIKYIINDPTTSDMMIEMLPPEPCQLKMNINGYIGGGCQLGTLQGQAAGCYVTINTIAKYLTKNIKTNKDLTKWAAVSVLNVNPRAGKELNAFYDRTNLKFFYDTDAIMHKTVYTSESADIVAHEFGHAFLDILRPDMWSAQSYEAWAFHESFGDIVAILNIMQYDKILERALSQTAGDMSKSNIVSRLAEELGKAIFDATGDRNYAFSLRDASNNFKYVIPSKLPENAPNDQLSNECHSFSRVWTGTWYECLVNMYKQNLKTGLSQIEALKIARDCAAKMILHACQYADTINFFSSAAQQMLNYDKTNNEGKYSKTLIDVFFKRNIIKQEIKMLKDIGYSSIIKDNDQITQEITDGGFLWKTQTLKSMTFGGQVSAQGTKTQNFSVDLPCKGIYVFDNNNNLLHATETSDEDIQNSAKMCVNYLTEKNLIGEEDSKTFEIKDGKLLRKKISCMCQPNNACNPNSPEYGKQWKGENNAGCGSKGVTIKCDCESLSPSPAPKIGCYTTSKFCTKTSTSVCQLITRNGC